MIFGSGVKDLTEFLREYPGMAVRPSPSSDLILKGRFAFSAESNEHGTVAESFQLTISVPKMFPNAAPVVIETGGRIPRKAEYHVNTNDNTLCLGSPLRILMKLATKPTLIGFIELCLIPYLFAISIKLRSGGAMVFDELPHGDPGIISDYGDILGVTSPSQVECALLLLGDKKRVANKKKCPCGCNRRLGTCKFNRKIASLRRIAPRSWYKQQLRNLRARQI